MYTTVSRKIALWNGDRRDDTIPRNSSFDWISSRMPTSLVPLYGTLTSVSLQLTEFIGRLLRRSKPVFTSFPGFLFVSLIWLFNIFPNDDYELTDSTKSSSSASRGGIEITPNSCNHVVPQYEVNFSLNVVYCPGYCCNVIPWETFLKVSL